jgi:hypothetical protein
VFCDVWHGRKVLRSEGVGKGRKASSQFTVENQKLKGKAKKGFATESQRNAGDREQAAKSDGKSIWTF